MWVYDANNNRASVEYWGSEEAAHASLATLKNCKNCTNCQNCKNCLWCTNCTNCRDCQWCENCTNCTDCRWCTNCTNCKNSENCTDCTDCADCWYCTDCKNCTVCDNCKNCTDCMNCTDCNLSLPHFFLPVSEPRDYTWLAVFENEDWRIRVGCRNFTVAEARKHWLSPHYRGPESVKDTVGFALDWLESKPIRG